MTGKTIAIIGAGAVGATTAYALLIHNIVAEILLIDIDEKRCSGEILDLSDALPFSSTSSIKQGTLKEASRADIIIIAAGRKQTPGQKRENLITTNKHVLSSIAQGLGALDKETILLIVTNPVDIMTYYAQQLFTLNPQQIIGTGTLLDSLRIRGCIAREIGVAEQSVNAYIIGEHGDSQVPAWSSARIGGASLENFPTITPQKLEDFAQQARNKAYEIIACKGATFYGIATCVAQICRALLFDTKEVMPLSVFHKEYTVCLSIPSVIGKKGIEAIIPIPLNNQENRKLKASALKLKSLIDEYL